MAFYDGIRGTADSIIRQYGVTLTIRDNESGQVVDPDTGMVTVTSSQTDYDTVGVIDGRSVRKGPGQTGEFVETARAYISAEGLEVVPAATHKLIEDDGGEWEITGVQKIRPANTTVLYVLQLSR